MPEYINKQEILEKAKSHQGSPFGASLIIREIEKADTVEINYEIDYIPDEDIVVLTSGERKTE